MGLLPFGVVGGDFVLAEAANLVPESLVLRAEEGAGDGLHACLQGLCVGDVFFSYASIIENCQLDLTK